MGPLLECASNLTRAAMALCAVSGKAAQLGLRGDTPYGKVRFAVPRHALRFYFPGSVEKRVGHLA